MRSARIGKRATAAARSLSASAIGTLVALAGIGSIAAGHIDVAAAAGSPISVTVFSDTAPNHHMEGGSYSYQIATFSDADAQPASDYTAAVTAWGDGSAATTGCTAASLVCTIASAGTAGNFTITTSHTYADENDCFAPNPPCGFHVTVHVTDAIDSTTGVADNIAAGGISVKDQPLALSASSYAFSPVSGASYSGPIGSFKDGNPLAARLDQNGSSLEYTFSINWGDGTPLDTTSGTFTVGTCGTDCPVQIDGTHTYANSNTYPVTIVVADGQDARSLSFTSTANVSDDGGTRCTSADLLGSSARMPAGNSIKFTAGAGNCSAPLFQFWLRYGTGSWTVVKTYSPTKFWTWDTSKSALGAYTIEVWAKQSGSTASYETFAVTYVTLFGCVGSVSDTPNPGSPQVSGTTVQLTASNTSGCPNPIYQFWVQAAPGSSTYTIAQPFSANTNIFNWNTSGRVAGTYNISVWVREANSLGAYGNSLGRYDAYKVISYTLTTTTCSGATITSAPPATATVGTPVPITVTASCPFPIFEFWLQYGSGSYKLVQKFSATSTWPWNTVGALPGAYTIAVWVKQSGASAATRYQTFAVAHVTLTGCVGSVSDVPSPTSPRASGTQVVFTAGNGSGCPNPRYQFWLQAPGSTTWTDVQPYTSPNGNVFTWTTTNKAAGIYKISVWVKDLNSGGLYGNSLGRYDSYTTTLISYTLT